jgi:predicted PurR-regulated permease PerM
MSMGLHRSTRGQIFLDMGTTARRAATATLVALSIVVAALALWKIKAVIALLFLGFIIAAAMRPGVDWLNRRARIPRGAGVLLHYLALLGAIGLFLWLVVPPALNQVGQAIGNVPTTSSQLQHQANHSTGIKHEILVGVQKQLKRLPTGTNLLHRAVTVTKTAFEVIIGIFFMFAVAAYWIFERDRAIALVQSLVPRRHRRVTRDTWLLIDDKLGAFVRGEIVLIVLVALVLSFAFWLDGEPYWILLGSFAGIVEIVPVIGPLVAGALAVGVGFTVGWPTAVGAAIAVLVLRQLEDLLVAPRVLGHAVGLSPLVVLVSVTAVGLLLGSFYVLLAIPIAAVLGTLIDVVLRDTDPAKEDVPTLLFPAKDAER